MKDATNATASTSVTLQIDKTPPAVNITSPTSGATVLTPQITVTGAITDAISGLASVACNGIATTVTSSNLSCNVSLTPGPNTITVAATDVAGNITSIPIPVMLNSTTLSIIPSITPAPNAAGWNNSNATVTFTCGGGVAPLTCPPPIVISAETAGQVVSGTVTDSTSKTATATVTVKLDKTAPSETITSPANGITVTSASQIVTGTVTDALSGIASLTCNGALAALTPGNFTCNVILAAGANSISVIATDAAGNTTTGPISVFYATFPIVTLTAPANLSYLNLSPTTVTGTVSDQSATVVINSITAAVVNGQFSAQVPLAEGPNILTAAPRHHHIAARPVRHHGVHHRGLRQH